MENTLDYYNKNANNFIDSTVGVDFSYTQNRFLQRLRPESFILDFGCGSGRDAKYFHEKGYRVMATDGSPELCRRASEYTGLEVKQMLFQELDAVDLYDGIWACSSILHLPKKELLSVLKKMCVALKEDGVIYTSFKYGDFEGERNGRYFTDFTEDAFMGFMKEIPELVVEEHWITGDVRPGREAEKWLNLIIRKFGTTRSTYDEHTDFWNKEGF